LASGLAAIQEAGRSIWRLQFTKPGRVILLFLVKSKKEIMRKRRMFSTSFIFKLHNANLSKGKDAKPWV
jgi:hypothetical protein